MFGGRGPGTAEAARRIKEWAREVFALDEGVTVLVSELTCTEPGCPPIETVIALLAGPGDTRKHTVHRAAADVTRADVEALRAGTR